MQRKRARGTSGDTRRTFLKSTTLAAGLAVSGRRAAGAVRETLALNGGTPAVSFPKDRHTDAYKWPRYGPEDKKLILEVLDENSSKCYRELPLLEQEWARYHNVPYTKNHCNGTSALTSMFFALDLPPGSEIMVPTYTFFGAILPMRFFGYVPIFIDIDPKTACFDLEHARKQLTPKTKAVMAMHSWGNVCDMDRICDWAREKGLIVLEDCAHCHGASLKDKKLGAWGDLSIFSFQATKPLPALEGGMGMYQKREHYERAAVFGEYKDPPLLPEDSPYRKYIGTGLGLKFRMHPLAAALARRQFKELDARNARIAAQLKRLNGRLTRLPGLTEPYCRPDARRVYYSSNVVFFDPARAGFSRDALLKALEAEGVRASAGDYPCQHKYAVYSEAKWWHHPPKIQELPGADQTNAAAVNLPLFAIDVPELVDQYVKAFEKIWANRGELAKA